MTRESYKVTLVMDGQICDLVEALNHAGIAVERVAGGQTVGDEMLLFKDTVGIADEDKEPSFDPTDEIPF